MQPVGPGNLTGLPPQNVCNRLCVNGAIRPICTVVREKAVLTCRNRGKTCVIGTVKARDHRVLRGLNKEQGHGVARAVGSTAPKWGEGVENMSELDQLESRLVQALDRIRAGVAAKAAQPAPIVPDASADDPSAQITELEQRLEEERMANAQLEERVRGLKERQDTRIAELEAEVEFEKNRAGVLDADLQGLRQSTADMEELVSKLRVALAKGLDDVELVNRAALAELDALKAIRKADRTEIEAILAELEPVIEETV